MVISCSFSRAQSQCLHLRAASEWLLTKSYISLSFSSLREGQDLVILHIRVLIRTREGGEYEAGGTGPGMQLAPEFPGFVNPSNWAPRLLILANCFCMGGSVSKGSLSVTLVAKWGWGEGSKNWELSLLWPLGLSSLSLEKELLLRTHLSYVALTRWFGGYSWFPWLFAYPSNSPHTLWSHGHCPQAKLDESVTMRSWL